jgi:predicted Zn-dependent protease
MIPGVGPGHLSEKRRGCESLCWLLLIAILPSGCGVPGSWDMPGEPPGRQTDQRPHEPSGEGPGGRRQPLGLSPTQELAVGRRAYREVLEEFRDRLLPEHSSEVRRVRHITGKIAQAVQIEPLQREINLHLRGYRFEWQVNVVRDRQINAFCLPAGYIFVFTELLQVAGNDDQVATVLAHEMAHALAHHASERVARERSGANILRSLSYDRMQEAEADHIGVFLMAFADYDPDQAVAFWQRMRQVGGKQGKPPEIFSDHPSDEHRVRDLQKWSVAARAAKKAYDRGAIAPPGRDRRAD